MTQQLESISVARRPKVPAVIGQGLLVAVCCLIFAVVANQLSPRGLNLSRNYFPAAAGTNQTAVRETAFIATNQSPAELVAGEIKAAGLKLASARQVVAWLADPGHQTQKIVFVDARNEEEYLKGHLPGAFVFDPYEPEKYFPAVVPVCQSADQIIVYCHGGDCDDSLSAANLLKQTGISGGKMWIYGGGMAEWETNGQPMEIGPQNSGQLKKGSQ